MKKLKRTIEIIKDVSIMLIAALVIFLYICEFFGYVFMEKFFIKIGITHPLRFCYIFAIVLIAIHLIFNFVFNKINRNH